MGTLTMLRVWVLSVVTILHGLSAQQSDESFSDASLTEMIPSSTVSHVPILPTRGIIDESVMAINVDHNMQVCSTWGNFHFSTFDGQFFQLPYTCNYILTTLCDSAKSDFNIQMRRTYVNNLPTISSFTIKIEGVVIQLLNGNVTMNQQKMVVPSYQYGIRIERSASFIKISSKMGLTVFWDEHNSLSIEISTKYSGHTCGLCGDFDGTKDNEFTENGEQITSQHYGLKWKMDAPTETCEEIELHAQECQAQRTKCEQLLSDPAFGDCHSLLSTEAFVEACVRDMCQCNSSLSVCLCDTLSEFSRQCAHAGGQPQSWRSKGLCGKECPFNLEHSECGSPCKDTCSNQEGSQVCADHCVEGCFCPSGTVLNDIEKNGCIPPDMCPCIHNGQIYQPGESYNRTCQECVCSDGRWRCMNLDCPGTCSLQGGSHIITYDGKAYTFHGNCYYVLSKDSDVTVLGKLVQCGQTDTETCLTEVKFIIPPTTITFLSTGIVRVNNIATNLPVFTDQVKIFKPSTFYIIVDTPSIQLVIQLVPIMQVHLVASSEKKRTLTGLCGNFNDVQEDDFKTESGLIEGTAATFANTWKVMTTCPDVSNCLQDPCSMSVEKETYAKEWCSLLTSPAGDFSPCHVEVNPVPYKDRCVYDTCKCAKSEECMCAAVSSYVHACAAKGVLLQNWRNTICGKFSMDCPGNMVYTYSLNSCGTTCRSLSGYDHSCQVTHTPVDGCGCAEGTYLNDQGECVPDSSCPCYYNDQVVAPSQVINKDGTTCTCTHGKLECLGKEFDCSAPMHFFNCSNAGPEAKGAECQKSCQMLDLHQCVNTQCTSGCMCPNGQLADGKGGCVEEKDCPCVHNGVYYRPGDTVNKDHNICTCTDRKFNCTSNQYPRTCTIYGEGHYTTFDGMRYSFSGGCKYVVAQDYCSNSLDGSFRIITENIPCGTTGTICSKSVKVYLEGKEFTLSEEGVKVSNNNETKIPYKIYSVGIYFAIEANNSLVLLWDKKTSLKIILDPLFKGKVCGLCGNYDGNGKNDFVTRGGEEVVEPLEFGNSWRVLPTCSKASITNNSCEMRPHRQAWTIKQCSIIRSNVFNSCHSLVDPVKYYDICVQDTCACDSGGDCECFCTAVAAYAAACREQGACISWRTPTICPLFCDFYNLPDGCEWHYKNCGQCVKTCSNPSGECFSQTPVEGCFPKCPTHKPYLNEETMQCVSSCIPTTTTKTTSSSTATTTTPSTPSCLWCTTTTSQPTTTTTTQPTTTVFTTEVSTTNATLSTTTTAKTTTSGSSPSTSTEPSTPTSTSTPPTSTPSCVRCLWSKWLDTNYPNDEPDGSGGEIESIDTLWKSGKITCQEPAEIECRAKEYTDKTLSDLGQTVTCDASVGLICKNIDQEEPPCLNYEIRVKCCVATEDMCTTTTGPPTTTPTTTTTTTQPTTTVFTTEVSTTTATLSTTTTAKTTTSGSSPSTSTEPSTPTSTSTPPTSTPSCVRCLWSKWLDTNYPNDEPDGSGGEIESIDTLWKSGKITCQEPAETECRAKEYTDKTLSDLGQTVTCDASVGLICKNIDQEEPPCLNYEIRVKCCVATEDMCTTTTGQPTTTPTTTTTTTQPTTTVFTTEVSTTTATLSTTTTAKTTTSGSTPSTSTEPSTPTSTSTPPTSTPSCVRCLWSKWLDTNYPNDEPDGSGGEIESIDTLWKSGKITCQEPSEIECRAKEYTDKTLSDLGQTVTCDASVGLICKNIDQEEPPCLNYEIRVKCCVATEDMCTTTTGPPTTTPTTTTTTTQPTTVFTTEVSTTTATLSTTTAKTTTSGSTPSTSTEPSTPTSTSTPPTSTPSCVRCLWSKWLDTNYPNDEPDGSGGEIESIDTLWKSGKITCQEPAEIECRAKEYTDKMLSDLGQTVTCDASVGLICKNVDQEEPPCLNYEIRVKCCVATEDMCTTTTGPPTTTPTTTTTTTQPTTVFTTEVSTTTATLSTTTTTKTTTSGSSPSTSTEPSTPTSTSTPPTSTPSCVRCLWSKWLDTNYPNDEPDGSGGEIESIDTLWKSGKITCQEPSEIECRAKEYTDKTLSDLGQTVTCDASVGLICKNIDQEEPPCLNYEIRVKCCVATEDMCTTTTGPPTTTPTTTTTTTQPTTTVFTTEVSTTTATLSTTTTAKTTTSGSTPSTSTEPSTPTSTSTPPTSTPSCVRCLWSKWLDTNYPNDEPDGSGGEIESIDTLWKSGKITCQEPSEIECRAKEYTDKMLSDLGQTVTCDASVGLICKNVDQEEPPCLNYEIRVKCCVATEDMCTTTTGPPTTTPTTTTTTTQPTTTVFTTEVSTTTATLSTTTTAKTTTSGSTPSTSTEPSTPTSTSTPPTSTPSCVRCLWSKWLDTNYPNDEPDGSGGEIESIDTLWKSGKITCQEPAEIECRAKEYTDKTLSDLGQTVTCDASVGLICKNIDQEEPPCLNYEIRVKCCVATEDMCTTTTGPPTTTPTTTTTTTQPTTVFTTEVSTTTATLSTTTTAKTTTSGSTPSTSTEPSTPTSTSTPPTSTPSCVRCLWSKWLDTNYPNDEPDGSGGEIESIDTLWKSGKITCQEPAEIECRAKEYTDKMLSDLGQTVTCDASVGLICKNVDQEEPPCLNYEIRVKCCVATEDMCTTTTGQPTTTPTTTTTTTQPTTTVFTTEVSTTTATLSTTTTAKTTTSGSTPSTSTEPSTPTSTSTPPTSTPSCVRCLWSKWLDTNYPNDEPDGSGGEIESIDTLWKSGKITCQEPAEIECRAKEYTDKTLSDLGQTVTCDASVGLICKNIDQEEPPCLNYEIRVKCCVATEDMCTTTTGPPTTTPTTTTTTTQPTTTVFTTEVSTTTATLSTTTKTTTSGSSPSTSTEPSTSTSTSTPPTSTPSCVRCLWSKWLDTNYPNDEPDGSGGEIESIDTLWKSGKITCQEPAEIECRAKEYTDKTLSDLGQTVTCDASVGLICKNVDQEEPPCLNYEIRVKCCVATEDMCTTTTGQPTTTPTTTTTTQPTTTMFTTEVSTATTILSISTTPKTMTTTTTIIPPTTTNRISTTVEVPSTPTTRVPTTSPIPTSTSITVETSTITTEKSRSPTTPSPPPTTTITKSTTENLTTSGTMSPTTVKTTTVISPTTSLPQSSSTTEMISTTTTLIPPTTTERISTTIVEIPSTPTLPIPTTTSINVDTSTITTEKSKSPTPTPPVPSTTTVVGYTTITSLTTPTVAITEKTTHTTLSHTTSSQSTTTSFPHNGTNFSLITQPINTTTVSSQRQNGSSSTTPKNTCSCTYGTELFPIGSFMYNKTDMDGRCFKVYCGSNCTAEKIAQPCPPTTSSSTTPTTTPASSTSTTITTPEPLKNCSYLNPPRQHGETWTADCMKKLCRNGTVSSTFACEDPDPPKPVCENNIAPVKINNGCCYHYECQCKCSGWGDPHYLTFDGQRYDFQGNCTYVLVQEIIKKHNFSVHIKNYYCDINEGLACPESLTIYYKSYKIYLTQTRNPTVNNVSVNDEPKIPAITYPDFTITSTGIEMAVNISAINTLISFKGLHFSITLPISLFYGNTEGQCGVCDNIKKNDCRLPNGEIAPSCESMAGAWKVNNTHCPSVPHITPDNNISPNSSGICEVILSNVFKKCHEFHPPEPFYTACIYDEKHIKNSTACFSLEGYASVCADVSVCVDWRNSTNGICAYKCPSPKVYKACGPVVEETCNSMYNDKFVACEPTECQRLKEGCFCPNGTTLFNTATSICTSFCGCVGPDGLPKQPGDKWRMNCKDCECHAESMGPVCKPVQCSVVEHCNKTGYEIGIVNCCPGCVCNTTLCPSAATVTCKIGFKVNRTEGDCCPTFSCIPKKVCVFNGTEYWPGVSIPMDVCKDCICGSIVDPKTRLLTPDCSPKICNTTCSQGFIYEPDPLQCCGKCVQQHCVYEDQNGAVYTIEDGQSFTPPNEKCVNYICTKADITFMLEKKSTNCPEFNPEDCIPGTVRTTPDGCCKTCELQNCRVQKNSTYLLAKGCTSVDPVEITSCSGSCDTSSIYSMAVNTMMHHCSCCQEMRTSSRKVKMNCPGQPQITHTYTYVEECGCHVTECQDKKSSD